MVSADQRVRAGAVWGLYCMKTTVSLPSRWEGSSHITQPEREGAPVLTCKNIGFSVTAYQINIMLLLSFSCFKNILEYS